MTNTGYPAAKSARPTTENPFATGLIADPARYAALL
jgi:hypothetical protein